MPALFFPDPNHESEEPIKNMLGELKFLAEKRYKTLFLEFLLPTPPESKEDLVEQFADCAAGRRYMAKAYVSLALTARDLGMKVVGLSLDDYYNVAKMNQSKFAKARLAFRWLGCFDAVAAELIRQFATSPEDYVVFLGAGHWPHLSQRLDSLELVGKCEEKAMSESEFATDAVEQANKFKKGILKRILSQTITVTENKSQVKVPNFGKLVIIDVPTDAQTFSSRWKEATGSVPDPDRVEAILLAYADKCK